MNFDKSKIIRIKGDASFRKFYRKKINNKSSIIIYSKKAKNKNLLNYDAINQLLNKIKFLHLNLFQKTLKKILLK